MQLKKGKFSFLYKYGDYKLPLYNKNASHNSPNRPDSLKSNKLANKKISSLDAVLGHLSLEPLVKNIIIKKFYSLLE